MQAQLKHRNTRRRKGHNDNIIIGILLFLLFCFYGPSLDIFGKMRIVELLILPIFLLYFRDFGKNLDKKIKLLCGLFLITAISQILSDYYNGIDIQSTIARAGSYIIMVMLLISLAIITHNNFARLRMILFGYFVSYILIYFIGNDAIINYQDAAWRLGLGFAVTLAVCLFISYQRQLTIWSCLALLSLTIIHIILGSRSLAIFTLFAGTGSFFALLYGSRKPPILNIGSIITIAIILISGVILLYQSLIFATEKNFFPGETQARMEAQVYSPYGLALTARPDAAAAIKAIEKQPITGYGSRGFDLEIWQYYIDISTSNWASQSNFTAIYKDANYQEWGIGIPSHSHILGAWADAGILASLSWFFVLGLAFFVILQSLRWRNSLTPLALFIAGTTFWDVIFSPGPHRMDIALRLTILCYIINLTKTSSEVIRQARKRKKTNSDHAFQFRHHKLKRVN